VNTHVRVLWAVAPEEPLRRDGGAVSAGHGDRCAQPRPSSIAVCRDPYGADGEPSGGVLAEQRQCTCNTDGRRLAETLLHHAQDSRLNRRTRSASWFRSEPDS
jgi:hypothetical protein